MKRRILARIIKSQIVIEQKEITPFLNYISTTNRDYNNEDEVWVSREDYGNWKTTQEIYDDWKNI